MYYTYEQIWSYLASLGVYETTTNSGVSVRRNGDAYFINGKRGNLEDSARLLMKLLR